MTPRDITGASFETKRKGYDPDAVTAHLRSAADTVSSLQDERDALSARVDKLEAELADKESQPAPMPEPVELDEAELTERLGQHAARVLSEARAAGEDAIAEAEAEADDIRAAAEELHALRSAEADEEAQRIRAAAEDLHDQRRSEAEQAAASVVAEAEAAAEQSRTNVSVERESADADANRIIREAELTRRQILEDLARRRSAARRQIEQLRAGRERLLASHETVRRALDEISEELTISMSEARAAAETAGHTVSDTTIEELEAEIETARLTGLLDTGPLPVVDSKRSTPNSAITPAPTPTKSAALPSKKLPTETDEDASTSTTNSDSTDDADTGSTDEDADSNNAAASDDAEQSTDDSVEPASVSSQAQDDDATMPADGDASADSAAEETASTDGSPTELAPVVQLDRARTDVDTGSHPAAGRDASSRSSHGGEGSSVSSSPALPSKKVSEAKDKAKKAEAKKSGKKKAEDTKGGAKKATVTKLESVKTSPSTSADSDVGDLFASLRSENAKPAKSTAKKKSSKKASSAKKSSSKSTSSKISSASKKKTSAVSDSAPSEPEVDSSEMARRLKRVLADEQSRAMSTVKSSETVPDVDDLLGGSFAHGDTYWTEVLGQLDSPDDASPDARASIDDLVSTIRRRVTSALSSADDTDSAVSSLRSVYRELKTQQIAVTADAVVRSTTLQVRS